MPVFVQIKLECDRCGYSIMYALKMFLDDSLRLGEKSGWEQESYETGTILCPTCAEKAREDLSIYEQYSKFLKKGVKK